MNMDMDEEYELYPNDEEFSEEYELQIALGLAEPPAQEVERRCFSSYWVSPYDTRRSTVPNVRLPQNPNVRMRLSGGGG